MFHLLGNPSISARQSMAANSIPKVEIFLDGRSARLDGHLQPRFEVELGGQILLDGNRIVIRIRNRGRRLSIRRRAEGLDLHAQLADGHAFGSGCGVIAIYDPGQPDWATRGNKANIAPRNWLSVQGDFSVNFGARNSLIASRAQQQNGRHREERSAGVESQDVI
jgi:hypothetical protein